MYASHGSDVKKLIDDTLDPTNADTQDDARWLAARRVRPGSLGRLQREHATTQCLGRWLSLKRFLEGTGTPTLEQLVGDWRREAEKQKRAFEAAQRRRRERVARHGPEAGAKRQREEQQQPKTRGESGGAKRRRPDKRRGVRGSPTKTRKKRKDQRKHHAA